MSVKISYTWISPIRDAASIRPPLCRASSAVSISGCKAYRNGRAPWAGNARSSASPEPARGCSSIFRSKDKRSMPEPIRILIVDDHAVVRKGLAMVLRLEPDLEVVGEAENGRAGLAAAQRLNPDIALVDLVMPEMDGRQMALTLRKANPGIKVMMLTGTEVDDRVFELVAAGIEGYVLKNIEPGELVRAIHGVAHGEAYLHPDVMKKVVARIQPQPSSTISLT